MQVHCRRRRPQWTDAGWRVDLTQKRTPPLGRAAFASGPGDLSVKNVHAIGLQVSDRIGNGVEMHPLAPVCIHTRPHLHAVPKVDVQKDTRMRENEMMIAVVFQLEPPVDNLSSKP